MMIRAYRMRGHLHANLDPLGLSEKPNDYNELEPENYGFTPADYNRKIFIDNVLGLEYATVPEMLDILKRTYCGTIGVEFMHISDPAEKPGFRNASKVRIKGCFHAGRQEGHPVEADRSGRLRAVHRRQIQGHQAFRPRWW